MNFHGILTYILINIVHYYYHLKYNLDTGSLVHPEPHR